MEEIFYAILALHMRGKLVNKENIRAVLHAAGTPVDEAALEAIGTVVHSLGPGSSQRQEFASYHKLVKFLMSELAKRNVHTKHAETHFEALNRSTSHSSRSHAETHPEKLTARHTEVPVKVVVHHAEAHPDHQGRYVYGVVSSEQIESFGHIGIEENEVYTICYKKLCAIVHNCPLKPYESNDQETVEHWVQTHQKVLDEAKRRFTTVIPLGFDVILQPKTETDAPDHVVKDWLKHDYFRLRSLTKKLAGKDEYGVEIAYDPTVIEKQTTEPGKEIKKLKETIASASPGRAYLYKQKLEKMLKTEAEKFAEQWSKKFYDKIKKHCDDIVVEKTRNLNHGKVGLMTVACLVAKENVDKLSDTLEEINDTAGFSVRFTGPWPPYNFCK